MYIYKEVIMLDIITEALISTFIGAIGTWLNGALTAYNKIKRMSNF